MQSLAATVTTVAARDVPVEIKALVHDDVNNGAELRATVLDYRF